MKRTLMALFLGLALSLGAGCGQEMGTADAGSNIDGGGTGGGAMSLRAVQLGKSLMSEGQYLPAVRAFERALALGAPAQVRRLLQEARARLR